MMKKTLWILFFMPLLAADCRHKKEGANCHYVIDITNNSTDSVILGTLFTTPDGKCFIGSFGYIPPGLTYPNEQPYTCWETVLKDEPTTYYILNKDSFYTNTNEQYSCDSFHTKYKILKNITINIESAQENNFTFYYP